MNEHNQEQKPKIVEMAKKRRHIHLLEKMQRGKAATPALSKTELKELEHFEADPDSPGIVDSQEKVAKIFGVSSRTVARWLKDGMPVTSRGEYDLIEIRAWRAIKSKKKEKTPAIANSEKWDAEYRECKAKIMRLEYEEKIGRLVPREVVEKELIQISVAVKRAFLALPRQLAPQLAGNDARAVEAILARRIKEAIAPFSEGGLFKPQDTKQKKKHAKVKIDIVD